MKQTKLRVLVDATQDSFVKNAKLPTEILTGVKSTFIDIDVATLSSQLESAYSSIVESVSKLPHSTAGLQLDEATFTLVLDSTGSVSLLSTLSGAAKSQVGITLKVRPVDR